MAPTRTPTSTSRRNIQESCIGGGSVQSILCNLNISTLNDHFGETQDLEHARTVEIRNSLLSQQTVAHRLYELKFGLDLVFGIIFTFLISSSLHLESSFTLGPRAFLMRQQTTKHKHLSVFHCMAGASMLSHRQCLDWEQHFLPYSFFYCGAQTKTGYAAYLLSWNLLYWCRRADGCT